jgi:enoyl-CoA hydratase/carnithine racemase
MLYTGKAIDARTAERWGLVNYVVSLDQLRSTTWELAMQIAQVSPAAIKSGKQAFFSELDLSYCDAYQDARLRMVHDAKTPDAIEGVDAFLSKRKPQWPSGSSEEPSCIGEG